MYNWPVDETELKKDPERHAVWLLEQTINFGLNGAKLDERKLRHYWNQLRLDPARRRFLHFLLHGRLSPDEAPACAS